ncbi:Nucleolar protein 16 [Cadophora gregata]|uniref:Nucleolar protein 16 n=1 Tax=Cadophora gregata TaxID=51156 RepID=UPI0026DCCCB7|nr:Nucleolar protein 16 [Cadophora gregata]KAK0100026.1 Nucleolar protein 16 [Cadophora gregata f. sp. sojae]KAK0116127.1 Nucleolar protein 16 [Cadophora gregata]
MGRELQKKKKRSSIPKIKMKPKSKRVNPLGNPIIAANWNQDETLTQNYRRLGLTSRLNSATGGTEKLRAGDISKSSTTSKLAISNAIPKQFTPASARVERDPTTGKILRVIHEEDDNPLNDPLNVVEAMDFDGAEDDGEVFEGFEGEVGSEKKKGKGNKSQNEIVRRLEEQASMIPEKKERTQSEREREWIERLVGKWGEDFEKMARDRKLNPMQQTPADIKRRVGKWKAKGGVLPGAVEA